AMYFAEVDRTLWEKFLNQEKVPVLLAGVEYLIPIYKQTARYRNLWAEPITGNHDYENIPALYAIARATMEPYFRERVRKAISDYQNHSATPLTSSIPEEVIPAAHYSKIAQLFVQRGEHVWGTFDEANNVLNI